MKLEEVAVDKDGNKVDLNKWKVDEQTGEKAMFVRLRNVPFCKTHQFNKAHECNKCPYMFTGFRANLHIQKADGIYDRKSNKKLA